VFDAATGQVLAEMSGAHRRLISSVEFDHDGTKVVTAAHDNRAALWDAQTGKLIATLEGHEKSVEMAEFSPDGRFILTASLDGTAKVWPAGPPAP
jgi:WD40 repeat protein